MGGIRPSFPVFPVFLFPDAKGFQKKQDSIIIRKKLKHFDLLVIAVVHAGFVIPGKSFPVRHYYIRFTRTSFVRDSHNSGKKFFSAGAGQSVRPNPRLSILTASIPSG